MSIPRECDLDLAALQDLRADAIHARAQAAHGPYYPERGITAESLIAYAEKCEAACAKYKNGGAHAAVIRGNA